MYLFSSGERERAVFCSGIIIDSDDGGWVAAFMFLSKSKHLMYNMNIGDGSEICLTIINIKKYHEQMIVNYFIYLPDQALLSYLNIKMCPVSNNV